MRILTLESSTSSAKAMLYSLETGKSELVMEEYRPEHHQNGNQQPEGVFNQTMEVGRRLCAGREVDLIVLCGTWHSVFLCDKDMNPVTPAYSWASTVAAELCVALRKDEGYVRDFYQRTGCMVNATYPAFKLMYLKSIGYDLTKHFVFGQGSYNTYRLVGQRVITDCMASGSGLMNIHTKQYDDEMLTALGLSEKQLSTIIPYRETYPLTAAGATLLGLKAGIPVVAACSDGGLNQVGIGGLDEGVMSFSVGTSAAIRLTTSRPILPEQPSTWCYLSPNAWMIGAATAGACNCVSWFKDRFLEGSFREIEDACAQSVDAPLFFPFIFGERCPGWNDDSLGVFMGLKPTHTKYDMYCAILEGTLFNVYHCYRILLELNGGQEPKIILSGGILNSAFWTQLCADIFGAPMVLPENKQSSLLGGIILGLELLGHGDQTASLLRNTRSIQPDALRHAFYQEKFSTYLHWYYKLSERQGGALS